LTSCYVTINVWERGAPVWLGVQICGWVGQQQIQYHLGKYTSANCAKGFALMLHHSLALDIAGEMTH
jgi:hypothetical protein